MKVINVRNVNEALYEGIYLIDKLGKKVSSRVGNTLEIDSPVATVYQNPWERVLINKARDANPFFHLFESLWILAGREDVKFLSEFNKNMVNYSDDGISFNAAYGYRLRNGVCEAKFDQLAYVIQMLKKDPNTRQAVVQIWDEDDLFTDTKDKACNLCIVFRIRDGEVCMTVYNRSNDMIWGAYGANAVQFSMIQEYVAAYLNLPMGDYTQITNSYHVYTDGPGGVVWDRIKSDPAVVRKFYHEPYNKVGSLVLMANKDMLAFEKDLAVFFNVYDEFGLAEALGNPEWESNYFQSLIIPILAAYLIHKDSHTEDAIAYLNGIGMDDNDWGIACQEWLETRLTNKGVK